MRQLKTTCIFCVIIFVMCSCTAEPKTDLIGFCNRVNRRTEILRIDSSAYYSDGENEYSYYVTPGHSDCILALSADSEACICEVRLTSVNGGDGIDAEAVFDYYLTLCSVLTGEGESELLELFDKNGLTAQFLSFADNSVEIEGERFTCFVYTNGQIVSLYCAIT